MSIRVLARAVGRPETRDALRAALAENQAPSRKEPGCVRYEIAQSTTDANEFVTIEEWRSEADVETHLKTPHVARLFAKVPALLSSPPDIRTYRVVGN
ncbi:MAG: putative quinol monooxygenase [Planctomycetota bacterium]